MLLVLETHKRDGIEMAIQVESSFCVAITIQRTRKTQRKEPICICCKWKSIFLWFLWRDGAARNHFLFYRTGNGREQMEGNEYLQNLGSDEQKVDGRKMLLSYFNLLPGFVQNHKFTEIFNK